MKGEAHVVGRHMARGMVKNRGCVRADVLLDAARVIGVIGIAAGSRLGATRGAVAQGLRARHNREDNRATDASEEDLAAAREGRGGWSWRTTTKRRRC